jgi:hypothetical protein
LASKFRLFGSASSWVTSWPPTKRNAYGERSAIYERDIDGPGLGYPVTNRPSPGVAPIAAACLNAPLAAASPAASGVVQSRLRRIGTKRHTYRPIISVNVNGLISRGGSFQMLNRSFAQHPSVTAGDGVSVELIDEG